MQLPDWAVACNAAPPGDLGVWPVPAGQCRPAVSQARAGRSTQRPCLVTAGRTTLGALARASGAAAGAAARREREQVRERRRVAVAGILIPGGLLRPRRGALAAPGLPLDRRAVGWRRRRLRERGRALPTAQGSTAGMQARPSRTAAAGGWPGQHAAWAVQAPAQPHSGWAGNRRVARLGRRGCAGQARGGVAAWQTPKHNRTAGPLRSARRACAPSSASTAPRSWPSVAAAGAGMP